MFAHSIRKLDKTHILIKHSRSQARYNLALASCNWEKIVVKMADSIDYLSPWPNISHFSASKPLDWQISWTSETSVKSKIVKFSDNSPNLLFDKCRLMTCHKERKKKELLLLSLPRESEFLESTRRSASWHSSKNHITKFESNHWMKKTKWRRPFRQISVTCLNLQWYIRTYVRIYGVVNFPGNWEILFVQQLLGPDGMCLFLFLKAQAGD